MDVDGVIPYNSHVLDHIVAPFTKLPTDLLRLVPSTLTRLHPSSNLGPPKSLLPLLPHRLHGALPLPIGFDLQVQHPKRQRSGAAQLDPTGRVQSGDVQRALPFLLIQTCNFFQKILAFLAKSDRI